MVSIWIFVSVFLFFFRVVRGNIFFNFFIL